MTLDEMLDYCDRVMEVYAPAAEAYAAAVEAMNPHRIVSSDRTDLHRDHLIRSVINSQRLSGVEVSRQDAERWLDEVLAEPLPELR